MADDERRRKVEDQAWFICGRITWTVEDWMTFYQHLTKAFMIIAARHAEKVLGEQKGQTPCSTENG